MPILRWSSDALPAGEQFEAVRAQMLSGPLPMRLERPGVAPTAGIRTAMELRAYGSVTCVTARSGPAIGIRDKRQIARTDTDIVCIVETFATGVYSLDGRIYPVGPGSVLITDSQTAMIGSDAQDVEFRRWTLPRRMVSPLLSDPNAGFAGRLDGDPAMGALIKGFLTHLVPALDAAGDEARDALLGQLAGLVAVERGMTRGAAEVGRESIHAAKLVLAKKIISQNLADPRLNPTLVAQRLGVSLRTLHTLFQVTGVSFSEFVLSERLERCHAALKHPGHLRRTVTDLAFQCGFDSTATFYRAFRRRYGCRPSDLR